MQILSRSIFNFKNDKIEGVWSEWEFDAYFSADIIMGYDINVDGEFDEIETEEIYNNAFISLKDFNYFTFIRVGNDRTSPKSVSDFSVYIDDNKNVVYRFYISLEFLGKTDFYLSVYDFTYFCACFYQEVKPVSFLGGENISPVFSIDKNEDFPIYFDPYAAPGDTTVHTEWKKGLNTLVIKEIHVEY